jgi:diguanylate cyclase (GGDEF)-like protein
LFLRHKLGYRVPASVLVCPLRDDSGTIGGAMELFEATSAQPSFQDSDPQRESALLDALTQIPSRTQLEQKLARTLEEYVSRRNPFSLMLLDLDGLRTVNDKHGRESGDALLQAVVKSLAGCLRACDLLGRWHEDQFLVILPGITEKYSRELGERCRAMAEKTEVPAGESHVRITISVGMVRSTPGILLPALLELAQKCLMQSKAAGGNRVSG